MSPAKTESPREIALEHVIETQKRTISDLLGQIKEITNDKKRWRNYAVLGVAGSFIAEREWSKEMAIREAKELLNEIEEDTSSVRSGSEPGWQQP